MPAALKTLCFLCAATALTACNPGQQAYYAEQDGTLVQIDRPTYEALNGASGQVSAATLAQYDPDGTLRAAMRRNPTAQRSNRQFDLLTASPDEIADVSLEIALDICNIPPGTRLTPNTPCNL